METKYGTWEHCSIRHEVDNGVWTERFLKCSECNYERCGEDYRSMRKGFARKAYEYFVV